MKATWVGQAGILVTLDAQGCKALEASPCQAAKRNFYNPSYDTDVAEKPLE